MSFPALKEKEEKLAVKRSELSVIFGEAGPEMDLAKVKAIKGTTVDKAAHIRKLNDECTDLGKEVDDLRAVQKAADRARTSADSQDGSGEGGAENGDPARSYKARKSFGQMFVESQAFKGVQGGNGPVATLDVDLKTLLTSQPSPELSWEPEVTRTGRLVEFATTPIQVSQIIPQTTTSQAAVAYMEETTFTNAAAETAEYTVAVPSAYPEAALDFTEKSSAVRKLAVFLPVTDEQLEDEPRVRGVIDNRLPFMIRQRLDSQILNGNGTAPNLRGILQTAGIQTQVRGTDPTPDAVYKAIVKVETGSGQASPNAVVFNPTDWQGVRLLRTADGLYIWGNPADAGPERIWGLPVLRAQALASGSALVGDFANFCELAVRRGIDVQASNSHADYFTTGRQAIRADMRVALVVYRPAAFCQVTL